MAKLVENPKTYCTFYKKFIVEELLFIENILDFHYGNCAVIGKIFKDQDDYFLENIRLRCLGKEHEIPEGSVKIRLLTNLYKDVIPDRKTVEIYGKAVLFDTNSLNKNQIPITLQDIYYQFNEFLDQNKVDIPSDIYNMKNNFNSNLLEKFEPAIQVRFINLCDQAEELIAYNLEIRLFS